MIDGKKNMEYDSISTGYTFLEPISDHTFPLTVAENIIPVVAYYKNWNDWVIRYVVRKR